MEAYNISDIIKKDSRGDGYVQLVMKQIKGIILFSLPVILSCRYADLKNIYLTLPALSTGKYTLPVALAGVAVVAGYFGAMRFLRESKDRTFPLPGKGSLAVYFSLRIAHLILYEAFFRGLMLWVFTSLFSLTVSIGINVLLYMMAHYGASRRMILACIPAGIILCLTSWYFGSALPAMVIHVLLSISYEFLITYHYSTYPKTITV